MNAHVLKINWKKLAEIRVISGKKLSGGFVTHP
jgi:hypothetical protein